MRHGEAGVSDRMRSACVTVLPCKARLPPHARVTVLPCKGALLPCTAPICRVQIGKLFRTRSLLTSGSSQLPFLGSCIAVGMAIAGSRGMVDPHQTAGNRGLILSLGSVNADFQVRVERLPEVSETLIAHDFARFGGGKAANVAVFARKLGAQVRLFGHVGDDDLAAQAIQPLRDIGVDLSDVKMVAGQPTGMAMVTVPPDGKKGIVFAANANDTWTDDDAEQTARAVAEAAPGSVLVVDCEVPVFVLERAAQSARQRGITVLLDPSPADRVTDSLLRLIDIVLPNSSEAKRLTGIECRDVQSAIHAGDCLLERGAGTACIKLGDGGCVLVDKEQTVRVAPVPVTVVDTTGAGDAFAGAMAVAVLEQRSHADAVRLAVAASHIAVTGYGAQSSYPTRDEFESMLHRLDVHTEVRQWRQK